MAKFMLAFNVVAGFADKVPLVGDGTCYLAQGPGSTLKWACAKVGGCTCPDGNFAQEEQMSSKFPYPDNYCSGSCCTQYCKGSLAGQGYICDTLGGICDQMDVPRGDCQNESAYKCAPSWTSHGAVCDQGAWVCTGNCGDADEAAGHVCDRGAVVQDFKCKGAMWLSTACVTAGLNASGTMVASDDCDVLGNICPRLMVADEVPVAGDGTCYLAQGPLVNRKATLKWACAKVGGCTCPDGNFAQEEQMSSKFPYPENYCSGSCCTQYCKGSLAGQGYICDTLGGICDQMDVPRGDCQNESAYKCPPSWTSHGAVCDQGAWVCTSNCGDADVAAGHVCDRGAVVQELKCKGTKWLSTACVTAGLNASGTMVASDDCDILGNICPRSSALIV